MSGFECPREHEVVAAVLAQCLDGRFVHRRPGEDGCRGDAGCRDAGDDDLAAHASACEVCRDAATVARLLREEAITARPDVQVPSAGQVWWRAAIRARMEIAQQVERPLTWVHGVAAACAAGLLAALAGVAWPSIERGTAWMAAQSWSAPAPAVETARLAVETLQRSAPLALVAAAFVILAPLAIYLATSDD
jgi:hypothetical protein